MAHETTLYSVLRVSEDASSEEIKQAYRRLVKLWHPDLNPDDMSAEKRMQEITEAYTVLSDPAKKRKYDDQMAQKRAAALRAKQEQEERARKAAAQANPRPKPVVKEEPWRPSDIQNADKSAYVDFTKPSSATASDSSASGDATVVVKKKKTSKAIENLTPAERRMEDFSIALCVLFPVIIPIVRKHIRESLSLYPDSLHYQDALLSLRIVTVFSLPLWSLIVFLIIKVILGPHA